MISHRYAILTPRLLPIAVLLASACDPGSDGASAALDLDRPDLATDRLVGETEPRAILPGFDLEIDADGDDVVLAWAPIGTSYDVWRSTDPYFAPGDPGSELLASTTETSFVDADAACHSCDDRYYVVQADGEPVSTTVGAHVIAVYGGYNKIALSLLDPDLVSASDLQPLGGAGFIMAHRFQSSSQSWQSWAPGSAWEFPIALGETPVVQLSLGGPQHRVLTGYVPAPGELALPLFAGDNLVALPLTHPDMAASELLAAYPQASRIGRWDPATQTTRWYEGPGSEDFVVPSGGDLHVDLTAGGSWPPPLPLPPGPDPEPGSGLSFVVRNDQPHASAPGALLVGEAPGTAVIAHAPSSALGATVTVAPDGTFGYEPLASTYGDDSFSITVDDGTGPRQVVVEIFVRATAYAYTEIGTSLPGYGLPGMPTILGDVNGDGLDDLAWSQGVGTDMRTYVAFGVVHPAPLPTEAEIEAGIGGFLIDDTRLPRRVGDVDGDGLADILVGHGAPGQTSAYSPYNNEHWIVFGKADTATETPATLAAGGGFHIDLDYVENRNTVGGIHSLMLLRGIGDFDGDGRQDFVVSASAHDWPAEGAPGSLANAGMIFVILGKSDSAEVPLPDAWSPGYAGPEVIMFRGDAASAYCGYTGSMLDADGDGRSDLLVYCGGQRYLVRGRPSDGSSPIIVVTDGSDPGITGVPAAGLAVAQQVQGSIGDFDGDGLTDAWRRDAILLGAPGTAALVPTDLAAGEGGIPLQSVPDHRSLRPTGDVDGDGRDDTYFYAGYNVYAGHRLTYGRSTTGPLVFDADPLALDSIDLGLAAGTDWDGTGDMDGDGFDDLTLSFQLLMGDRYRSSVGLIGGDGDDLLTGSTGDDAAVGGRGNDVIELLGGSDSARGGAGDDLIVVQGLGFRRIDGGNGDDVLAIQDAGADIDLASIYAHRLQGIETLDLSDAGAITLSLRAVDVARISGTSNTLTIVGVAGTTVSADLVGEGFALVEPGTWSNGVLTLVIQGATAEVLL